MKTQIKVDSTRMHKVSLAPDGYSGENAMVKEAPVAEAKLVLVDCKDIIPMSNQLAKNKTTGNLFIATVINKNAGYLVKPILISETEKIEVGDWMYNHYTRVIRKCEDFDILTPSETWSKVLALPEHFSPKHLQAIVDGKLKDGDKVLVECQTDWKQSTKNQAELEGNDLDSYIPKYGPKIKLNSSNHITLHKAEVKMYPLSLVEAAFDAGCEAAIAAFNNISEIVEDEDYIPLKKKWFEQNVK